MSFMMTPEGSKRSLNVTVDFAREDQRLMGYHAQPLNVNTTPCTAAVHSEIA
jgi:hypothetical protein